MRRLTLTGLVFIGLLLLLILGFHTEATAQTSTVPAEIRQDFDQCIAAAARDLDDRVSDAYTIVNGVEFHCRTEIQTFMRALLPPGLNELQAHVRLKAYAEGVRQQILPIVLRGRTGR